MKIAVDFRALPMAGRDGAESRRPEERSCPDDGADWPGTGGSAAAGTCLTALFVAAAYNNGHFSSVTMTGETPVKPVCDPPICLLDTRETDTTFGNDHVNEIRDHYDCRRVRCLLPGCS